MKITLIGSDPKIWRRVEVHSGLTLDDLHVVIQCVFGWEDYHLYHFLAPPGGKLTRKAMAEATRFHVLPPDPGFDDEEKEDVPADDVLVGRVLNKECPQIVYEYDFGDSWEHLVRIEKRTTGGDQDHVPVCLAGENAAPLEDSGGMYGYYNWLDALQNEMNPMHEEAVDWLGKGFDPAHFDLNAANKSLAAAFKIVPKKPRKPRKKKD